MSEMVERVALAIGGKVAPALRGGPSVTLEEVARAAIEAMREPTGPMIEAGCCVSEGGHELVTMGSDLRRTWPAMIDAALTAVR